MKDKKVVLVSGSSRGIGANLVRNFAKIGYMVVINYFKSEEKAERLLREIEKSQGPKMVLNVKADVSKREQVINMFDKIMAKFGRIDVLVNNAGVNIDKPFLKLSDKEWNIVIDTVLTGTFICSQEFAYRYRGENGHIINIGAHTGIQGRKDGINYCSAKAGVITATKCLALELAPKIKVNCVHPGMVKTEEVVTRLRLNNNENLQKRINGIPLGRLGDPDEVFGLMKFIVDDSSYITGANFFVNGGLYMG